MKFDCWFKIDQKWKYFFMWNFHTDFRKIMFIDGFSFWADLFRRKYFFDLFLTNHFGVIQNCFVQMDCFWVDFRGFFWMIWKNLRELGFNRLFWKHGYFGGLKEDIEDNQLPDLNWESLLMEDFRRSMSFYQCPSKIQVLSSRPPPLPSLYVL